MFEKKKKETKVCFQRRSSIVKVCNILCWDTEIMAPSFDKFQNRVFPVKLTKLTNGVYIMLCASVCQSPPAASHSLLSPALGHNRDKSSLSDFQAHRPRNLTIYKLLTAFIFHLNILKLDSCRVKLTSEPFVIGTHVCADSESDCTSSYSFLEGIQKGLLL